MKTLQKAGPYKDIVDAPAPDDPKRTVKLGVRVDTFQQYAKRGLRSPVAQYYGIVENGFIRARHLFRGLKRPLMHEEDMHADETVLVYTWCSQRDYEWKRDPNFGEVVERTPPAGKTFVVLVRQQEADEYAVSGSIEKWNWVEEDPGLPHAPIDWEQRYMEKLWTRT